MPSRNSKIVLSYIYLLLFAYALAQKEALLETLLPHINQENFQLTPNGNQYQLHINLPDGSERNELVELKNAGAPQQHLAVLGRSDILHGGLKATITYTADKQGYVVKYKYSARPEYNFTTLPPPPPAGPAYLNPLTLKTAAG